MKPRPPQAHQHGAALATALLFLIVLTLLGIGAMIEALLHGWRRWISVPVLTILLVVLVLGLGLAGQGVRLTDQGALHVARLVAPAD